jgi:hypothetical protein
MNVKTLLGLVLAAVIAGAALQQPAVTRLLPPCPVWAWTGLNCPGCGSGRALAALARGDVAAAAGLNPLLGLLLPAVGGMVIGEMRARHRGVPFVVSRWTVRCLIAAIAAFTVARNLPGFGFLGP